MLISLEANAKVKYEEPNGSNGYYTKNPSITIEYDGWGTTKYRLKNANGRIWNGELDTQNKIVTLQAEQLSEGANYLDVWIETENGKIDESMDKAFYGQVYACLGAAYGRQFLYKEAANAYKQAVHLNNDADILEAYLYCCMQAYPLEE